MTDTPHTSRKGHSEKSHWEKKQVREPKKRYRASQTDSKTPTRKPCKAVSSHKA